jgi:hypothetical protein
MYDIFYCNKYVCSINADTYSIRHQFLENCKKLTPDELMIKDIIE